MRFQRGRGLLSTVFCLAVLVLQRDFVSAQQYGNCGDVNAQFCDGWISLEYCGPYDYENDALPDMESTASSYLSAYGPSGYPELYWWGRVTPYNEPGYYSSGWMIHC